MPHSTDPTEDRDATDGRRNAIRYHIGGYLLERPIASSAGSAVYRAVDPHFGRRVALKFLTETACPQSRERFLHEMRMIAGLHHPNIVLLFDAGEDDGIVWAAMELMPGTLAQELHRAGRFSGDDLRAVIRAVCLGLDAVWQRGMVHRDIKPSNLFGAHDGVVKVADFGWPADVSLDLHLQAAGMVLGTPWYMSPEQAAGMAGVATDLYALGATLYHLAAGQPAFGSSSALDAIVRHALAPVPPLPADVPAPLSRLIMWLLEKDPARRPADYRVVLGALDGDVPEIDRAPAEEDRALALWNHGRLAEKAANFEQAIENYSRLRDLATRVPAMLLDARIARLRGRITPRT